MKKFLVIRFSSIGDIVLTTPVVRCLKKQLPDCEVHYLTKEQYRPLLEGNPYIDKVFTIKQHLGEVIPLLRKENYDHLVDLHRNFRSLGIIGRLRKPYSTFNKLNIRKFLICKLKMNFLPDIHIVDRYFRAVAGLGVSNDGQGLDYFIPEDTDPYRKLQDLPRQDFICLVIGGRHATKQLPQEKLLELCRSITKPIVILGGPEDKGTADYLLKNHHPGGCRLFSTTGLLTLHEAAYLIRACSKVITHDTGLMHIAAAFRKDIISVWGNTIPEFGMYPYFPKNYSGISKIVEVKNLPCRPCSKLGYRNCPKGHFRCMKDIPLGVVITHISGEFSF